jgi:hypothetical protein
VFLFFSTRNENLAIKFYARKMLMHVRFRSLEKKVDGVDVIRVSATVAICQIAESQYGKMMEEKCLTKFEVNS